MSDISLRFTPESQQDIDDIQQYTLDQWGDVQMERYQAELFDAFERIRQFPQQGRLLDNATRQIALRHHVVLYRYDSGPETVTILRVIHSRRLRGR